jgi:hypothetical protein
MVSGALVLGLLAGRRFPLAGSEGVDTSLAPSLADPELAITPEGDHGPVLVAISYRVASGQAAAFAEAMDPVERARRRSGAYRWRLFQDAADPERFVEAFLVTSWEEHLRQHSERLTVSDRRVLERVREHVLDGSEPEVTHLLAVRTP